MKYQNDLINKNRRLISGAIGSTTLLYVVGCGGGGSEKQGAPDTAASPASTGTTIQSFPTEGGGTGFAVNDTTSSAKGQLYASSLGTNRNVLTGASIDAPEGAYDGVFDDNGNLTKISESRSGTYVVIATIADRVEYRFYDKQNNFIKGLVVRVDGEKLIAGKILQEKYSSDSELLEQFDVTNDVQNQVNQLADKKVASASFSSMAFQLIPISAAIAADPIDKFAGELVVTIGSLVLLVVAPSIAIGIAVKLAFDSAILGGIATALAAFLILAKTAKATPLPTTTFFNGSYSSTTPIADYTHVERNSVSGIAVSGNHTFTNGKLSGSFTWRGVITSVTTAGGSTIAVLAGNGLINNIGARRFILNNSKIEVNASGQAIMYWSGTDSKFGPIGGVAKR